jgi:hypothetical protein
MDRFTRLDGYVSEDQLNEIQGFFQSNVFWTYGWLSDKDKAPYGHWKVSRIVSNSLG